MLFLEVVVKIKAMSVLVSLSIFPLDKGESVGEYAARAIKVIHESGFPYKVSPMETVIETETVEEALEIVQKCFKALEGDCNRIICHVRMDYRKGKSGRIVSKVKSVEEKLSFQLQTL